MILAVADCAEGKGPPPGELMLAWQAQTWNTLPEAGGLRDQPAGLIERMSATLRVYDAMKIYADSPPGNEGEFTKQNPRAWEIVLSVMGLRRAYGHL